MQGLSGVGANIAAALYGHVIDVKPLLQWWLVLGDAIDTDLQRICVTLDLHTRAAFLTRATIQHTRDRQPECADPNDS